MYVYISFHGSPYSFFQNFRRLFPPSLSQPTLAVLGLLQQKGPFMPIVEMQTRWAVKVFAGKQFQVLNGHTDTRFRSKMLVGVFYL